VLKNIKNESFRLENAIKLEFSVVLSKQTDFFHCQSIWQCFKIHFSKFYQNPIWTQSDRVFYIFFSLTYIQTPFKTHFKDSSINITYRKCFILCLCYLMYKCVHWNIRSLRKKPFFCLKNSNHKVGSAKKRKTYLKISDLGTFFAQSFFFSFLFFSFFLFSRYFGICSYLRTSCKSILISIFFRLCVTSKKYLQFFFIVLSSWKRYTFTA